MSKQANRFKRDGVVQHPKQKFEDERQEKASVKLQPKNNKQKLYQHLLEQMTLIVADGIAGSGKTLIPCYHAASLILAKKIDKIVLVRPYSATGNKTMGYPKGELNEKIIPFMLPMIGYLKEALGAAVVEIMMKDGRILIQPMETIRGMSFKNAYIISDEMQCAEIAEIQALVTRIGENTTLVLTGDSRQNDVKKGVDGISYIKAILDKYPIRDSGCIEFGVEDCVRSGICRDFILAFEKDGWK